MIKTLVAVGAAVVGVVSYVVGREHGYVQKESEPAVDTPTEPAQASKRSHMLDPHSAADRAEYDYMSDLRSGL